MAYEADRVVVELIAKTDALDGPVKQSATVFDASMNKIEASAGRAEKAHGKLNASVGNTRIAMLEFQHIARGTSDQLAAGAPVTQVLAQHMGMLSQAVSLAGGTFGKFGAFLGGPWGIAATLAAAVIGRLIIGHKDESDTLSGVIEKLKEHARHTNLSEEADRIWTSTLDGLIDRQHKLNEELGKRLNVQELVDKSDLERAKADAAAKEEELATERTHLDALRKQLAKVQASPGPAAGQAGAVVSANQGSVQAIQQQIEASKTQIAKLETALRELQTGVTQSQIVIGQQQGKALADLAAKAHQFSDIYKGVLTGIIAGNPTLSVWSDRLFGAAESLDKATNEAASVGVEFIGTTNKVAGFDRQLNLGQITVKQYTAEILKLAKALQDQADAAKEAAKHDPVKEFKAAVVGAEGSGPNQMGSSAAGIGQFIKSTWLFYVKQLPDAKGLADAALLKMRDNRTVATAVIDKATDDYVSVLKAAGQQISKASLYAFHLLSAGDPKGRSALRLLNAPASEPTSNFLSQKVLAGNPFLKGTAEQARAAIAKRIGDSSAAISQGTLAIVQALAQEKERLRAFQNARASLEDDVLDARRDLGLSAQEVAEIEHAAVEAARKNYEDNIKSLEDQGKYTKDEVGELIKLNDERAKLRGEIVERRKQQAEFRQQEARNENALTVQTGLFDAQKELLQSAEALATTGRERRKIEDRLIDIQFEEERMRLQAQISLAARLKAEAERTKSAQDLAAAEKAEAEAAVARQKLKNLPQEQANAHTNNAQQNATPLQSYFDSIPDTADEINAAFENIATHGLQTFNDALANAIVNYTSLGDVGRAVLQGLATDLIKLALQQIELHTIGQLFNTAATTATVAQMAVIGAAAAGPAALVSLATSGANAIGAQAGITSTVGLATLLGTPKAEGGRIFGPGSDTSDSILTPTSADEFVIRAKSARSVGYAALEEMNSTGRLPSAGMADGGPVGGERTARASGDSSAAALSGAARDLPDAAHKPDEADGHLSGHKEKSTLSKFLGVVGDILFPAGQRAGLFASGGRVRGAGTPTSDSVPINASVDEFIVQAASARKIGYSALEHINAHGKAPGMASGGRVTSLASAGPIMPMNVPAAQSSRGGGFSSDDIRQLRGIVSDAVRATPDIALYPTIDPVDVLSRALGSTHGRRVMFDFMGANSTAIRAQQNRP